MDAIQQSLDQMMAAFNQRLDTIEGQLPKVAPVSPGSLAEEFATFKTFVLASMRALQNQIAMLGQQADELEMRSRRKFLQLHGVPEEDTTTEHTSAVVAKVISTKINLSGFSKDDISRCHRMGHATNSGKPRPILFKLRDCAVRSEIWYSKTQLKGSGITISEFLTKARHDIFAAARQRFGVTKCWTRDGSIYILGPDGTRRRVSTMTDIDAIAQKETVPQVAVSNETEAVGAPRRRRAALSKK